MADQVVEGQHVQTNTTGKVIAINLAHKFSTIRTMAMGVAKEGEEPEIHGQNIVFVNLTSMESVVGTKETMGSIDILWERRMQAAEVKAEYIEQYGDKAEEEYNKLAQKMNFPPYRFAEPPNWKKLVGGEKKSGWSVAEYGGKFGTETWRLSFFKQNGYTGTCTNLEAFKNETGIDFADKKEWGAKLHLEGTGVSDAVSGISQEQDWTFDEETGNPIPVFKASIIDEQEEIVLNAKTREHLKSLCADKDEEELFDDIVKVQGQKEPKVISQEEYDRMKAERTAIQVEAVRNAQLQDLDENYIVEPDESGDLEEGTEPDEDIPETPSDSEQSELDSDEESEEEDPKDDEDPESEDVEEDPESEDPEDEIVT